MFFSHTLLVCVPRVLRYIFDEFGSVAFYYTCTSKRRRKLSPVSQRVARCDLRRNLGLPKIQEGWVIFLIFLMFSVVLKMFILLCVAVEMCSTGHRLDDDGNSDSVLRNMSSSVLTNRTLYGRNVGHRSLE